MTDETGFELLYVAALRSVGIAARLNEGQRAELWTGNAWQEAPRPIIASWSSCTEQKLSRRTAIPQDSNGQQSQCQFGQN